MRPPLLARLLLRAFLPARDREFILGDLEEEYVTRRAARGRWPAGRWYWRQAIASVFAEGRHAFGSDPGTQPGEPRRGSLMDALWQDTKYAWRSLNRRPVFTSVAVLTIALGIGANTGIFSIANWLLLRPVAGVTAQHELSVVEFAKKDQAGNSLGLSWLNFVDMRSAVAGVASLAGATTIRLQVTTEGGVPRSIDARAVGGNYFGVIGVTTRLGRPILEDETKPGHDSDVAVISERLWSESFQRDPRVVGRTLRANKSTLTIVGVAANGFRGTARLGDADVWVPYSILAKLSHSDPDALLARDGWRLREVVARLKPGITVDRAQRDLNRALGRLVTAFPSENELYDDRPATVYPGIGVPVWARAATAQTVKLMLIIVSTLLLISSANVANMLLVRGLQRRADMAMRRALGASGRRLAMQQLVEGVLLALAGGAAGLLVARVLLRAIEGGQLLGMPPIENVPLDLRVLGFAALVSIVTGVVFGLAPVIFIRPGESFGAMQQASGRHTGRAGLVRNAIILVQVSLTIVLLSGALMLARTVHNLRQVSVGFDPTRVTAAYLTPQSQGIGREELPEFQRRLLEAIRAQPDVEAAALSYTIPFMGMEFGDRVFTTAMRRDTIDVGVQYITDGYFDALGLPLIRGRAIDARDWTTGPTVVSVVLSESAARRLFGAASPLGHTITSRGDRADLQVVGVVPDSRMNGLTNTRAPLIYKPLHVLPTSQLSAVVRPRTGLRTTEPALRHAIAAVEPGLAMDYQNVDENVRRSFAEQRLLATILVGFSLLAVVLAGIGLYGVLAYNVSQRTREFGIRMALGAQARRVLAAVVSESAILVGIGLALGVVGAWWLSKLIESQLYGVDRFSPSIYASAALLFLAVAVVATVLPTRAAVRVDPLAALRHD